MLVERVVDLLMVVVESLDVAVYLVWLAANLSDLAFYALMLHLIPSDFWRFAGLVGKSGILRGKCGMNGCSTGIVGVEQKNKTSGGTCVF